ncbi:hypothetical protein LWI29_030659 [Acer saccharum]|uniref:Uncharacterized protein n=1 Tax=Acer saccharum TaxID=4024 RepID=A0AA39RXX7_ACESA|nr:hypothetical protein LWI29_030659 [Acer saccharum]
MSQGQLLSTLCCQCGKYSIPTHGHVKRYQNNIQHAKSLFDSLAAINELVSITDFVTAVLRGLGSNYGMIITAILNFPPLPKFEDLRALPSFGRGQHRSSSHGGHRGYSRGRGRAPWHSTPDYSAYGSSRGSWLPHDGGHGIFGAPPSQWCSTCSTPQHSNLNCPHHYHDPESLTAQFAGMHVASYPPPPDYTWYPDTSATHHMTSTAPPNSVPFNGNTSVLLSNRATLPITNTGNLPLSLGSHKFSLSNIFKVSSLNKNLLSVARFTKYNSVSFTFTPSSYTISDLTFGVPLFQGPCKDGLYSLSLSQPFTLTASASNL